MQNCDSTSDKCNVYRKYNQSLFHFFFYFFQQNLNVSMTLAVAMETVAVSK